MQALRRSWTWGLKEASQGTAQIHESLSPASILPSLLRGKTEASPHLPLHRAATALLLTLIQVSEAEPGVCPGWGHEDVLRLVQGEVGGVFEGVLPQLEEYCSVEGCRCREVASEGVSLTLVGWRILKHQPLKLMAFFAQVRCKSLEFVYVGVPSRVNCF